MIEPGKLGILQIMQISSNAPAIHI